MQYFRYTGPTALAEAQAAALEIHTFLQAQLDGYAADKWADPIPHPSDLEWLVPVDMIHRRSYVTIPPETLARMAAREVIDQEQAEALGYFPSGSEV